jgi:serine/threonine protein kinase
MPETRRCPQCQAELPPDAPEGLCPECLWKEAMKSGSEPGHEHGVTMTSSPGAGAPPPEELARHFPQLEILELLGQGGMGIVYKARQPGLDRLVALKILPEEAGRDPAFAERFAREARALAKLTHPGVVAVYDFGQSDGRYYLLMEFVDGVNLRHVLREGRLRPEEALKIVPQICEALQYAHEQGVVHRDIKPENILLDRQGHVKIADFGLAKLLGPKAAASALTGSGQVMGTPHYMAPEQMERPLEVDHRADIYSLGVVFYEMLTGELPLGRFAPPSQRVQVDVRLDEVVLRALAKEPERRYQHASDVKTEVESITSGTQPAAPKSGPQGVPDQVLFKRVTVLTLIGLAVWNVALAALNWGYSAQADWYFSKELPYEWLQTLLWSSTLVCLGFGSWWFYLLVKTPGTPRSFQDFGRVWRTFDPRLRPAWKPLLIWFGIWLTAEAYVLWRFGFEENVPFLWVMQGGLGLTPVALMAMFWLVIRQRAWWRRSEPSDRGT